MRELTFRGLLRRDYSGIRSLEGSANWDTARIVTELRRPGTFGCVAVRGGAVLGYAIYRTAGERIDVLRVAVASRERRRGVGKALLRYVAWKGELFEGVERVRAVVSEMDLASAEWLKACGFKAVLLRGEFGDRDGYEFGIEIDREMAVALKLEERHR